MKIGKRAQDAILEIVNGQIFGERILIGDRLYSLAEIKEYLKVNFDMKRKPRESCLHDQTYEANSFSEYNSKIDKVIVKKQIYCRKCGVVFYKKTYRKVSPTESTEE